MMMNQCVRFGADDHLLGVLSRPVVDRGGSDIGVLMLTAGMLPSCGPYRLHVELADRLASMGAASLRFDLSGIGESFPAPSVDPASCSLDRAAAEVSAAMDAMTEHVGIERFVLMGLCSGADDALHTAMVDHRVTGLTLIDGPSYRTVGFHWRRLTRDIPRRVLTRHFWGRRWAGWTSSDSRPESLRGDGEDIREFADRDVVESQFRSLLHRDVRLHFVYTGGMRATYNDARQFAEMFPSIADHPRCVVDTFDAFDHTLMLRSDRETLVTGVIDRLRGLLTRSEPIRRPVAELATV